MKINLKVDPETLFLVFGIVRQSAFSTVNKRREGKARQSMHLELFQMMSGKCVGYSANPNGKKRAISLRFHLANEILELVKTAIIWGEFGIYEKNKLELLKNELHQKLQ